MKVRVFSLSVDDTFRFLNYQGLEYGPLYRISSIDEHYVSYINTTKVFSLVMRIYDNILVSKK